MHAMSSLTHITSRKHTSAHVVGMSNSLWVAVEKTLELDHIVDVGELCVYVNERILNNSKYDNVFRCVIEEYVSARLNIQ